MKHGRRLSVWLALMCLLCVEAGASGPRYVTGPPFFPVYQAAPIGWKQTTLLYSTDPGDLSANVNHAAADALVAAAVGVWNLPNVNITVGRGGLLAEHSSGANVYLDANGMEFPADVMATNAAAVPIAVLYDTDGSVTETLLGAGASAPAACRTNAVTESVDSFDPQGYILHAVLVLNGRCTGPAAAQQLEMQYKLERAFGRVLGLAWSQANDNVFTGSPTPTYNQALHWPILHPIDILCGPYSYQCLPNPFTLRPDDIASMVLLYPIANGAPVPAGKQPSLQGANRVEGRVLFPSGQGMAGVNVLIRRNMDQDTDSWFEASAVTGARFRRADVSPFTATSTTALGSMGTVSQEFPGQYTIEYLPLPGPGFDNLIASTEAVDPLYTGSYSLGPYGLGTVSPSGANPAPVEAYVSSETNTTFFTFTIADAATVCGTGTDGTAGVPAQIPATGWWNATLCGYGHASYVGVDVKPGRTLTVEASALDAGGLPTMAKAMPVIGLFAGTDQAWDPPSLGLTGAAFNGLTLGTTTLGAATGTQTRLRVGVADERGDGRPDFSYQGRVFYADTVEPVEVPAAGGTVTITGMGFRTGNAVLVNGIAATVTKWSANVLVVTVPALKTALATAGTAVDVEVLDRGTGATSTVTGALTYVASGALPNAMILLSAPSGTQPVGTVVATPLSVKVVASDGVTPVVGDRITFAAVSGTVLFAACGQATCTVATDATGTASTGVTPGAEGTVVLQASDGTLLQKATFTAQAPSNSMRVLLAPTGSFPVGQKIATPFVVRVYGPDGSTGLPNHELAFSVAGGSAIYNACQATTCASTTDYTGASVVYVTPTGPGLVTLKATDGPVSATASFMATQEVETLQLVAQPNATGYVNENQGTFSVRLMHADGTGDYYKPIVMSGPAGVLFSGCPASTCTIGTDTGGTAGTTVLPTKAGTFTVQASYGTLVQTATFSVGVRTQTLRIVSTPPANSQVGVVAAAPFAAQWIDYDGVTPVANQYVTLAGANDAVMFPACHAGTCKVATDANGIVSATVMPLIAGTISLDAVALPLLASTSFTAVNATETMQVVAQPGTGTIYVGDIQTFSVRLLAPDGVTPEAAKVVAFMGVGSFAFAGCAANGCTVVTDANGIATVHGAATAAGSVAVTASYGSLAQTMGFVATAKADTLHVVSAPASGALVGDVAATPFAVQVLAGDGVTAGAGKSVTVAAGGGTAALGACAGAATCVAGGGCCRGWFRRR